MRSTLGATLSTENPSARTHAALVERLSAFLAKKSHNAIIIDTVEYVDRGTLAVLQATADKTGSPIILGRSRDIRSLVSAGSPFTRFEGPRIALEPLDFVSTAALAHDRLGQWPDAEVASRLFSKSSGVAGLAVALIDGAKNNGLIRLDGEQWVMSGRNLRSGEADSWIEAHLALLTNAEFDTLRQVATGVDGGTGDSPGPLDRDALRTLDGLGLITARADGAARPSVQPPILADYLHRPLASDPPSAADDPGRGHAGSGNSSSKTSASLSHEVATFRNALEQQVLDGAKSWSDSVEVATALPYLATLAKLPRSGRIIQSVFDTTRLSTATSAEDAFDFIHVHQMWRSRHSRHTVETPNFTSFVAEYPEWKDAIAVLADHIEDESAQKSDTALNLLADMTGGSHCIAAIAYRLLQRGDFPRARAFMARIPESGNLRIEMLRSAVATIVAFADRDYPRLVADSEPAVARAQRLLDHSGILLHSYAQAMSLAALSRWGEARTCVSTALAFGPPGSESAVIYRALLVMGAFIEIRSGNLALADRLTSEAEGMDLEETGLPSMQDEFPLVIRSLIHGHPADAMHTLRALARRIHLTGTGSFAAESALRLGLVLWPEESTLDELESVLDESGGHYSARVHEIARLSFTDLSAAAEALENLEEPNGLGFLVQMIAGRIAQENQRNPEPPNQMHDAMRRLESVMPTNADRPDRKLLDADRSSAPDLTARELEIALLVRTHSNAAIAARLGVSSRTVENHIHSAMKKRSASTRFALHDQIGFDSA